MLVPALILIISWTCDGMALKHTQISAIPIARRIGNPSYTMTHMPLPSVMPTTEITSRNLRISSASHNSELFGVYVCVLILVSVAIIYFNQNINQSRLPVSRSPHKKPYLVSYDDLDMNNMYRHVRRQVISPRNTVTATSSNTTASAMV